MLKMSKKYALFRNPYQAILDRLAHKACLKDDFFESLSLCDGFLSDDQEEECQLLKLMGAPLVMENDWVYLSTSHTSLKEQKFCFVDIESNGSDPLKDQVIEIGAVLYQNGCIIDRFESFVFCDYIPDKIIHLTHIELDDLVNAPVLSDVLTAFRSFLGDAIFVAHNVSFDFNFLNAMLFRCSMGWLCNRRLCTIALAKKTIISSHYSLACLNEYLGIHNPILHRAYADAYTASQIFIEAIKHVDDSIVRTAEDLIAFSNAPFRSIEGLRLINDQMLG